jgi:hypothetical protein
VNPQNHNPHNDTIGRSDVRAAVAGTAIDCIGEEKGWLIS